GAPCASGSRRSVDISRSVPSPARGPRSGPGCPRANPTNQESGMAIRVFHADDHQTFRDGMRLILEREPDVEVVGAAGDTSEAFKTITRLKPDVALLDLSMPGGGVLAMVRRLRTELPTVKVLILTMFDSPAYVHEA